MRYPWRSTDLRPRSWSATVFLAALLVSCGEKELPPTSGNMDSNAPSAAATPGSDTSPRLPAAALKPDGQKLKGKWLRPDGGYVLEIKNADEAGRLEAFYFNPRSIHVARAEATRDGAVTKVFIELRDINYPGSTYTLAYDPENDQLKGVYFQAVERQNFEVLFVRMP